MAKFFARVKFAGRGSTSTLRLFLSSNASLGKTHYETLGVPTFASKKEIRNAYIDKSKQYHPDSDPSDPSLHQKFVAVQLAYDVLSSDKKRGAYDHDIGRTELRDYIHGTRQQTPRPPWANRPKKDAFESERQQRQSEQQQSQQSVPDRLKRRLKLTFRNIRILYKAYEPDRYQKIGFFIYTIIWIYTIDLCLHLWRKD